MTDLQVILELAQTAPLALLVVLALMLWRSGVISFKGLTNGKPNGALNELKQELELVKGNHLHEISEKQSEILKEMRNTNEEMRNVNGELKFLSRELKRHGEQEIEMLRELVRRDK